MIGYDWIGSTSVRWLPGYKYTCESSIAIKVPAQITVVQGREGISEYNRGGNKRGAREKYQITLFSGRGYQITSFLGKRVSFSLVGGATYQVTQRKFPRNVYRLRYCVSQNR